jgi:hypothetical protein
MFYYFTKVKINENHRLCLLELQGVTKAKAKYQGSHDWRTDKNVALAN